MKRRFTKSSIREPNYRVKRETLSGRPVRNKRSPGPQVGRKTLLAPRSRFGAFTILRELGQGAMGVVYLAWQKELHRKVALKILTLHISNQPELLTRFQREAQAMARLHHENIVRVFSSGKHAGYHYYVMEYVRGKTLQEIIATERLSWQRSARIVMQAARGIAAVHAVRLVHRDIKPGNIMVTREQIQPASSSDTRPLHRKQAKYRERALVMDFGLVMMKGQRTLTHQGQVIGSPSYMSPEQAMGMHHQIDYRTDIYSLGATLYEAVTQHQPFSGENVHALLLNIATQEPRPPRYYVPYLDRDLELIIQKAMAKEVARRYHSAADLAQDLENWLQGAPIQARPAGLLYRLRKTIRQNQAVTLLLLYGLCCLSWLLVYFLYLQPWRQQYLKLQARHAATAHYWRQRSQFEMQVQRYWQQAVRLHDQARQQFQQGRRQALQATYLAFQEQWHTLQSHYQRYQQAVRAWQAPRAVKQVDLSTAAWYSYLADFQHWLGQDDKWLQSLAKVYRQAWGSPLGYHALFQIAIYYYENLDLPKARAALSRLVVQRPTGLFNKALCYYGQLLFKQGEVAQALGVYRYLLQRPDLSRTLRHTLLKLQYWSQLWEGHLVFECGDYQQQLWLDLDGDRQPELLLFKVERDLEIRAYHLSRGHMQYQWRQHLLQSRFHGRLKLSVTAGDLSGDGRPELVIGIGAPFGRVCEIYVLQWDCHRQRLHVIWQENLIDRRCTRGGRIKALKVADVNNDGRQDIVIGAWWYAWQVGVYENNGKGGFDFQALPVKARTDVNDIAVADVDGDGRNEILLACTTNNAHLVLLRHEGGTYRQLGALLVGYPVCTRVVDLDGNGQKEILMLKTNHGFSGQTRLPTRLRPSGLYLLKFTPPGWQIKHFYPCSKVGIESKYWVLDLDHDGRSEILLATHITKSRGSLVSMAVLHWQPDRGFEEVFGGLGDHLLEVADGDVDGRYEFYYQDRLNRRLVLRGGGRRALPRKNQLLAIEEQVRLSRQAPQYEAVQVAKDLLDMGFTKQASSFLEHYLRQAKTPQPVWIQAAFLLVHSYLQGARLAPRPHQSTLLNKAVALCEQIASQAAFSKYVLDAMILKAQILLKKWDLRAAWRLLQDLHERPLLKFEYTPDEFQARQIKRHYTWLKEYQHRRNRLRNYAWSLRGIPNNAPYRIIMRKQELGIVMDFRGTLWAGIPFYYDGQPLEWQGEFRVARLSAVCELNFGLFTSGEEPLVRLRWYHNVNFQQGRLSWYLKWQCQHKTILCWQQNHAFAVSRWYVFNCQVIPPLQAACCRIYDRQTGRLLYSGQAPLEPMRSGRYYLGILPRPRDYRCKVDSLVWLRQLRICSGSPQVEILAGGATTTDLMLQANGYLSAGQLAQAIALYTQVLQRPACQEQGLARLYRAGAYLMQGDQQSQILARQDLAALVAAPQARQTLDRAVEDARYQLTPVLELLTRLWSEKYLRQQKVAVLEKKLCAILALKDAVQQWDLFQALAICFRLQEVAPAKWRHYKSAVEFYLKN